MNNWYHTRPREYYPKCVKMFGKPTAKDNTRHGFALWVPERGLFDEHLLRDENVKHCVPRPHHDYFYSSCSFYVPKHRVWDVLKISGSIMYDGLKHMLTARCGGIGANYATLYLGMMVANEKLTIQQVKQGDMYPLMIQGKLIPHEQLHSIMEDLKKENHKKYKKELKLDYAPYAYSKCYTKRKGRGRSREKREKKARKSRKTRKGGAKPVGKSLRNTRNESCSKNDNTACCPHEKPDEKGRYRATNEVNTLRYRGGEYELHTCCNMCAKAMNKMARENPEKFKKHYVGRVLSNGDIVAKNHHTGKEVQIMKRK